MGVSAEAIIASRLLLLVDKLQNKSDLTRMPRMYDGDKVSRKKIVYALHVLLADPRTRENLIKGHW